MYDPTKRLHALYPLTRTHPVVPTKTRRRRKTASPKTHYHMALIVCIVSPDAAVATTTAAFGEHRFIHARAQSEAEAATMAKTFGYGNMLLYVLNRHTLDIPMVHVGITKGCQIHGMSVTGAWAPVTDISNMDDILRDMNRLNLMKYRENRVVFAKKCSSHVASLLHKNIQAHAQSRIENRFTALAAKIIASSDFLMAMVQGAELDAQAKNYGNP